MISFGVCIHRSGSSRRLSSGASNPKKPKKRKTSYVGRSKRATSPGVLNDEDWAILEREEDEQPLRHGKGLAERLE